MTLVYGSNRRLERGGRTRRTNGICTDGRTTNNAQMLLFVKQMPITELPGDVVHG